MSAEQSCPACNHVLVVSGDGFRCEAIGCGLLMPNRTHETLERLLGYASPPAVIKETAYQRGLDDGRKEQFKADGAAVCGRCRQNSHWASATRRLGMSKDYYADWTHTYGVHEEVCYASPLHEAARLAGLVTK